MKITCLLEKGFFTIVVLLLCACTAKFETVSPQKHFLDTTLNIQETKTLGEPMIVNKDGLIYPSFVAIDNAQVPNINLIVGFSPIKVGDVFNCDRKIIDKDQYYCSNPNFIAYFNPPSVGCILIDNYGKLVGRGACSWFGNNNYIDNPRIVFKNTHDFKGFRQELIYNGKSQNSIKVQYREFNNDMIRPAFFQELSFDLSESPIIGFRGMRIEVIKATNSDITFIVRSPMNK